MSDASRTALIAIDWGTTSARAYRIGSGGEVLAERAAALGIQAIPDQQYVAAFDALLGDWRDAPAPRLACGMVGSRQGWIEAPYSDCPVDLASLGRTLVRTPGSELAIVPGVRCYDSANIPDVMRGEETQILGSLLSDDRRILAVLPGTHSKWAIVDGEVLVEFATFMTGELYALLMKHSILGRMAGEGANSGTAFAKGVARGIAGGGLAHSIFGARTLALAGELHPGQVGDWLSGVLIGQEIDAARAWARDREAAEMPIRVIGDDAMVGRYLRALEQAGMRADRGRDAAAAHGLFRIARRAGLVH